MNVDDQLLMMVAKAHLGSHNILDYMKQYTTGVKVDGFNIIDLESTWRKILVAANKISKITNPAQVFVMSRSISGQHAARRFAKLTGGTFVVDPYTKGSFTRQVKRSRFKPLMLILTNPAADEYAFAESSYLKIPVIAFCNLDSHLRYTTNVIIPCNNKSPLSMSFMWWILARQVLRERKQISSDVKWHVTVDCFFHRHPDEVELDVIQL